MTTPPAELARLVANGLNDSAKLTLAVLGSSKGPVPKTRMQKLAFLAAKVLNLEQALDASAYHFGPFSENVVTALHELRESGVVKASEDGLTPFGSQVYSVVHESDSAMKDVAQLADAVQDLPDRQLVSMVYDLFPEYTDKSLIKNSATAGRDYQLKTSEGAAEATLVFDDLKVQVKRAG